MLFFKEGRGSERPKHRHRQNGSLRFPLRSHQFPKQLLLSLVWRHFIAYVLYIKAKGERGAGLSELNDIGLGVTDDKTKLGGVRDLKIFSEIWPRHFPLNLK